jgi:carbon storage regulator
MSMLVLTRRIGQEIVIGDNIHVTVLEMRGNEVRLGITAPPAIRVDRLEVKLRRQEIARQSLERQPALMVR